MASPSRDRILCIIPARGGSKRLPRKNALLLNGIPLVSHTIRAARESGVFAKIVLSTDDEEIAGIARAEHIDVDMRPAAMAHDDVSSVEVVAEYLRRHDDWNNYGAVAKMLPTCPFRTKADVCNAVDLFVRNAAHDFLVGVVAYEFPVNLALRKTGEHEVQMVNPQAYVKLQSQDQETLYHPNGSIYLATTKAFRDLGTFFGERFMVYEMPAIRSLDIDYPYQFEMANILAAKMPYLFEPYQAGNPA